MHWNGFLLADDNGVVEIIIAVFAVLFWVLKAAAGSVSAVKAKQQQRNPVAPPLPPVTARTKPPTTAIPFAAARQQGRAKAVAKQPARRPITPPPLPTAARANPSAALLPPPLVPVAPDATTARRAISRAAETAQLIRPGSLRAQFILTELLQPPIALRADREV